MGEVLRVLLVEDSEDDAILLIRELERAGYELVHRRVETSNQMREALGREAWEVIIVDYVMPRFGGLEALALARQSGLDVPLIVVSGKLGEDMAVEAMKAGAHDYITKHNLSRFVPAIQRELREAADRMRARDELKRLQQDWESISQAIAEPVIVLDPEFRVLAVNRAALNASTKREEEVAGQYCYRLFHEAKEPPDSCPMKHVLAADCRERVETEVDIFGGTFLVSCTPVFDREGRLVKAINVAKDITSHKKMQRSLEWNLERSQRFLYGMVDTMTLMCEMKDPYTAGHQRGVSRIACAIAEEMRLPAERAEGIRVAALLHDIGKIFIPAEILSKPGRLTEIERGVMQTHVQTGHRVLKDIESPWPLAQIVLQHHERLDGSGYPAGLAGGAILLEARILGVADVVDAMSSHRPYRPALGVDKAREEVASHRGILYDCDVADACLRVLAREEFDSGSSQKQAYREAVLAVTGGRLRLVEPHEMKTVVGDKAPDLTGTVSGPLDVPRARRAVERALSMPESRQRAVLLCFSEALTNAVRHAGSGKWYMWRTAELVRLMVQDTGPGMRFTELPKVAVMQHYSTKQAPGSGFALMLYHSDGVYLATGQGGTTLVLEFAKQASDVKADGIASERRML